MNKRPVPAGADTNTRPYAIFFSYLAACLFLTLYVVRKLLRNYVVLSKSTTARPPPRKYVLLFVGLAVSSLGTTWYYMIRYFRVSYKVWMMWRSYYDLSDDMMHWGLWLRDTSLFKEAWEIAIVGNARYWWTHQIFFFACALGMALEQKGVRRGIRHTWVFMVIGQIVAISFATNLFLIALLLSPPAPPAPSMGGAHKRKLMGPWVINFIAIFATLFPAYLLADESYWHHKSFLPVLLIPHLALLVLPLSRAILPSKYFREDDVGFMENLYKYLWGATIFGGALLFWRVTSLAYGYSGFWGTLSTLLEHPAVSSVGFDTVFCWVTWICWWMVQSKGIEGPEGFVKEHQDSWDNVGATSTTTTTEVDATVRRR
ncbi:hypothetical protein M011DRAFT_438904 [Sporormia fimetaria CBS 119925]|uniref:Uncharacterized protein n=1 Tax=Sporormia fimetaria CBS 119925 TaxID=1340428 RepID=A0A6A6VHR4_9PLEO|nr:hypothetical protein M011DRAFT_438904 [Sporormia fimetaria CBS 119925]